MKIFKYYPKIQYLKKLIQTNKLYFSDLSSFNDPFEKYLFFKEENGTLSYSNEYKKYFRACCFTTDSNNYLMWSHYANKHKGFCVEFNFPFDLKSNIEFIKYSNKDIGLLKMDYDPKLITVSFNRELDDEEKMETIRYKSKCWDYENEIRFVLSSKYRFLNINNETITNVFLGVDVSINDKIQIKNIIEEYNQKINIKHTHLKVDDKNGFIVESEI